ncbi:hypothetical protein SLEP1_g37207 [Rubroshorea leprosula]|uniref:Uncharacterized protein n=1 Tax=Rubroshorea leprosula TaxID=152421 RepID=A0AAV5KUG3_9ROSI|nr:hypothetical protein SLEP1_g37207 [Rubroshorea leprosula]
MDFFRELRELRDLPKRITTEKSASSSVGDDDGNHHASPSNSSSSEETPSHGEGIGDVVGNVPNLPVVGEWESRIIAGWLSNFRKAPKDLPAGFRFKAALHHEVADSVPSISGYKKLEEMVRLRAGSDAVDAQQHKIHHKFYAIVCEVGDTGQGDSVRVAIPMSVGSQLQRCKVVLPLWEGEEPALQKQRINNDLATRLSEWCMPNAHLNYPQLLPRDTDLKNQLLEYARGENLIDLEALITSEQLAVFRFVDVANQFTEEEMSSILEKQRQRAQGSQDHAAGNASHRQTRFDERPPPMPQSHSSSHRGSNLASRPRSEQRVEAVALSARKRAPARSPNVPSAMAQAAAELAPASTSMSAPWIAYPEGFSYVKTDCQPAMVQGMQSFVPLVDRQRARTYVQQHSEQVAMIKLMDAFSYAVALFESEQGAHTAEELASRNNELREELEKANVEKEMGLAAFQDAVAVASTNMTMEIYNEIRGKVLQHRPDFPIREPVFFDWEDLDEQVLEEGEDLEGLPSFDAWVEGAPVAESEPSNTPPNSQPAVVPTGSPVTAPACKPTARPSPAHASGPPADASMLVDLTDD